MSVKLKVSYERPEELKRVLSLLHPDVKRWKVAGETGRFKRAYVELGMSAEPRAKQENLKNKNV